MGKWQSLPIFTAFSALKVVPKAIKLIWEVDPNSFRTLVLLIFIQGLAPATAAYVAKLLVDLLVSGEGPNTQLWILIGVELAIWSLWSFAKYSADSVQQSLRERLWNVLSLRAGSHAATLDLSFFENPKSHDTLSKAMGELSYRPAQMLFSLLSASQDIITVLSFFGVVFTFQPILAIALLVTLLPTLFAARDSGFISFTTYDMTTSDGRRAKYFDTLLMSEEAAKEIRLYDLAPEFLDYRRSYAERLIAEKLKAANIQALKFAKADIFSMFFQYSALAFVAWQTATARVTIGDFTLLVVALSRVRQQLAYALASLGEVLENSLFFEDLTKFFETKPQITPPSHPKPLPNRPIQGITFENVTFSYPGSEVKIFDNFNLTLKAGEATAIVGVNGAGKTTLVKLITRLYDPQGGRIKLDNFDIRDFDPKVYRQNLGVILQDFVKYQLTARENISLAKRWEAENLDAVEKAARMAKASDLIDNLPNQWETYLGRQFEVDGQNLSGGQWQRIALARLLYRDAPILILDEPTAALDAEAEAAVFESYRDIAQGRTSLLITHRFNTVKMADRIVVLDKGRVVEDGNHQRLMREQGAYFRMFTTQASSYDLKV